MFPRGSRGLVAWLIGATDHVVDSNIAITETNHDHAGVVMVNVTTEDISTTATDVLRIGGILQ